MTTSTKMHPRIMLTMSSALLFTYSALNCLLIHYESNIIYFEFHCIPEFEAVELYSK